MSKSSPMFLISKSGRATVRRSVSCAELIENGAIRPIITIAGINQVPQHSSHILERLQAACNLIEVDRSQLSDGSTSPLFVAPQSKQVTDCLYGKSQQACASDETQFVNVANVVSSVTVCLPIHGPEQSDTLIVADGLHRNAGQPRCIADKHHCLTSRIRDLSLQQWETLEFDREIVVCARRRDLKMSRQPLAAACASLMDCCGRRRVRKSLPSHRLGVPRRSSGSFNSRSNFQ